MKVRSNLLGCLIAIVEGEPERQEALRDGVRLAIYSRAELIRMKGLPPGDVKTIHATKKMFGGRCTGEAEPPSEDAWFPPVQLTMPAMAASPAVIEGEWGDTAQDPHGGGIIARVSGDATRVPPLVDSQQRITFSASEAQNP